MIFGDVTRWADPFRSWLDNTGYSLSSPSCPFILKTSLETFRTIEGFNSPEKIFLERNAAPFVTTDKRRDTVFILAYIVILHTRWIKHFWNMTRFFILLDNFRIHNGRMRCMLFCGWSEQHQLLYKSVELISTCTILFLSHNWKVLKGLEKCYHNVVDISSRVFSDNQRWVVSPAGGHGDIDTPFVS